MALIPVVVNQGASLRNRLWPDLVHELDDRIVELSLRIHPHDWRCIDTNQNGASRRNFMLTAGWVLAITKDISDVKLLVSRRRLIFFYPSVSTVKVHLEPT